MTGAGLVHLRGMKGLKMLDLSWTEVILDGDATEDFLKSVPGCKIRLQDPVARRVVKIP